MPKVSPGRIKALIPDPEPNGVEEGGTPVDTADVSDRVSIVEGSGSEVSHSVDVEVDHTPSDTSPPTRDGMSRDDMVKMLKEILKPQGKRGIPSEVSFFSKSANATRVVVIDINDGVLLDGWALYKRHFPEDPEEYLACVYDALQMGVPRMFRYVVPVKL